MHDRLDAESPRSTASRNLGIHALAALALVLGSLPVQEGTWILAGLVALGASVWMLATDSRRAGGRRHRAERQSQVERRMADGMASLAATARREGLAALTALSADHPVLARGMEFLLAGWEPEEVEFVVASTRQDVVAPLERARIRAEHTARTLYLVGVQSAILGFLLGAPGLDRILGVAAGMLVGGGGAWIAWTRAEALQARVRTEDRVATVISSGLEAIGRGWSEARTRRALGARRGDVERPPATTAAAGTSARVLRPAALIGPGSEPAYPEPALPAEGVRTRKASTKARSGTTRVAATTLRWRPQVVRIHG